MTNQRAALVGEIERLFRQVIWQGRRHFGRRVQAFGLTLPQYAALYAVGRHGPNVTMSEIGDQLQIPPSSMTSIVDRLVRDGLAERGHLPNDRRAVAATITAAGADLVATVERLRHADLTAMLDGLSEADLASFVHVLSQLSAGVERLIGESPVDERAVVDLAGVGGGA